MEKEKHTLESMRRQREELRRETAECAGEIRRHWEALFTPPPADTKVQRWVAQAEKAVAVYDGVMTGYKLMRRLGALSPWGRKRRSGKRK